MMSSYRDIIKGPIITEKSSALAQNKNTITFSVDVKANKTQIKQAIERIFNVKVESVNTINVHPRKKRVGKYTGMTNRVKKAIVKLKEGSSIELN
jgi:large subunit ribosomal protein L23